MLNAKINAVRNDIAVNIVTRVHREARRPLLDDIEFPQSDCAMVKLYFEHSHDDGCFASFSFRQKSKEELWSSEQAALCGKAFVLYIFMYYNQVI